MTNQKTGQPNRPPPGPPILKLNPTKRPPGGSGKGFKIPPPPPLTLDKVGVKKQQGKAESEFADDNSVGDISFQHRMTQRANAEVVRNDE